jgi:hypothetical protein
MVKVNFESGTTSVPIAVFADENIYDACFGALDKLREKLKYETITESIVDDVGIDSVFNYIKLRENK